MVLKRRLEYGFDGYQIPVVPRAPRSNRRGLRTKRVEDSQICAFELLAAVADKLLQESNSAASSNVVESKDQIGIDKIAIKKEQEEEGQALKTECQVHERLMGSTFVPNHLTKEFNLMPVQEFPQHQNDTHLENTSMITHTLFSDKVDCDMKSENCSRSAGFGKFFNKTEACCPDDGKSCNVDTENADKGQCETIEKCSRDRTVNNTSSSKDPSQICVNTRVLINLENSLRSPSYGNHVRNNHFPKHRNNVNLGIRDDDENSFGCNKSSTKTRLLRPPSQIRYQRIRKMLTSKYWKVAPKLKDCELTKVDRGIKPSYCNKKNIHTRERCLHEGPFKKRKLFNHCATVVYDEEASSGSISNSPEKGISRDKTGSDVIFSSVKGHQTSFQPKDSHVKFSIKSFRVPELYIEVPETSTVGSLKRSVLEAITAVLGGELRVGILHQGKKVRDDNRTLLQSGISCNGNLDALGFSLEPGFFKAPPSSKDFELLLPCDANQQISRHPASPISESGNTSLDSSPVTDVDNPIEKYSELVTSHENKPKDEIVPYYKALLTVPAMNPEPLAAVPMNQRPKRSEFSQRRTRRPFSVTEVEALVEAVEQLGTGRWRDVKIRAFDTADHRTYVDLKDKWKTLVHTASISPQQRRGEPVPQELLDRVLAAHAYWSQHQLNKQQHSRHQTEPIKISDAQVEGVGA